MNPQGLHPNLHPPLHQTGRKCHHLHSKRKSHNFVIKDQRFAATVSSHLMHCRPGQRRTTPEPPSPGISRKRRVSPVHGEPSIVEPVERVTRWCLFCDHILCDLYQRIASFSNNRTFLSFKIRFGVICTKLTRFVLYFVTRFSMKKVTCNIPGHERSKCIRCSIWRLRGCRRAYPN